MNPKTGIIILNYNGWYDTIECLQSVFQIEYDNYEVVLVDNASTDDSLLRIRTYCNNALKVDPTFLSHSHLQQPTRLADTRATRSKWVKMQEIIQGCYPVTNRSF